MITQIGQVVLYRGKAYFIVEALSNVVIAAGWKRTIEVKVKHLQLDSSKLCWKTKMVKTYEPV